MQIAARRGGKNHSLIDQVLERATAQGIRVEVIQPNVQRMRGHLELLIDDLKGTREDGSVLTAGHLIHRLRAALAASREEDGMSDGKTDGKDSGSQV